ncbi:MAG: hypothetical protein ACOWWR_00665 [Eubacteriales bacterium]
MKFNTENCCEKTIILLAVNLKGIKYCPWCGKRIKKREENIPK